MPSASCRATCWRRSRASRGRSTRSMADGGPEISAVDVAQFPFRYHHRTGDERALESSGIPATRWQGAAADQLGRLSPLRVDAIWLVPHFWCCTIMLARRLYLRIRSQRSAITDRCGDTRIHPPRDAGSTAFYSIQDADSEGVEEVLYGNRPGSGVAGREDIGYSTSTMT
jgi:hypothetical protein